MYYTSSLTVQLCFLTVCVWQVVRRPDDSAMEREVRFEETGKTAKKKTKKRGRGKRRRREFGSWLWKAGHTGSFWPSASEFMSLGMTEWEREGERGEDNKKTFRDMKDNRFLLPWWRETGSNCISLNHNDQHDHRESTTELYITRQVSEGV